MNRILFGSLLALGLCLGRLGAAGITSADLPLPAGVKVLFSPKDDLEAQTIRLINHADTEILFNQYAVTDHDIAVALVDAFRNRKVYVVGIIEKAPGIRNYSTPEFFKLNGIPVVYAESSSVNENRYVVIDRKIVATGSYTWTMAALKKKGNLLILTEPTIALAYVEHFHKELEKGEVPEVKSLGESTP